MMTNDSSANSMKSTFEGLLALEEYSVKTGAEMRQMRKATVLAEEMSKTVSALVSANTMLNLIDQNDGSSDADRQALANQCRKALRECMDGLNNNHPVPAPTTTKP